MPRAYSYLRFSTPEQRRGDSSRRQLARTLEWCSRKGIPLDDRTFHDLGKSGYTGANFKEGALGRFCDLVRDGTIESGSSLLIESLDRFSRENPMVAANRLFDLVKAGIAVVTVDDGQEYSAERLGGSDVSTMLLLVVKLSQSHLESVRKSEMVSQAWAKKRTAARAGTHKMTKRVPEWLSLEGDKFIERQERVDIVERIFRETIEGFGRRTIANRLNEGNEPAFKGKHGWHASSIAKILLNRAVLGEYQPGTGSTKYRTHSPEGEPIQNYYPQIIDETTFWRARHAMQGRRKFQGRRGAGVSHLLTGLAKCNRCKGPMHIINKGKPPKGAIYFECSTARRKAGCSNTSRWRVDEIERRLLRHLPYIDADAILNGNLPVKEAERVELLKAKLTDVEHRRDTVADMLEVAKGRDSTRMERYGQLVEEAESVGADLKRAEEVLATVSADPGLKARLSEAIDLSRAMEQAKDEERTIIRTRLAEQLRKLVREITFDNELSIIAVLHQQSDVREDQIPWVWGASHKLPWLLFLDSESNPHGDSPDEWEPEPDPKPLPPGLRRLAEQGRRKRETSA